MSEEAASWNPALRPDNAVEPTSSEIHAADLNESLTGRSDVDGQEQNESRNANNYNDKLVNPSTEPSRSDLDDSVDLTASNRDLAASRNEGSKVDSGSQPSWFLESETTEPFSQLQNSSFSFQGVSVDQDPRADNGLGLSNHPGKAQPSISQDAGSFVSNSNGLEKEGLPGSVEKNDNSSGVGEKEPVVESGSEPFALSQDTWELDETSKSSIANVVSRDGFLGTDDEWGLSEHGFDLGSAENKEPSALRSPNAEPANDAFNIAKPEKMEAPKNDDLAEMWKAALGDEEFLEETAHTNMDGDISVNEESSFADEQWLGAYTDDLSKSSEGHDSSLFSQPKLSMQSHQGPGSAQFASTNNATRAMAQPQTQRLPSLISRAESYSDKSKGGYHSPYDLPIALTKARKRPSMNPSLTTTGANLGRSMSNVPPPRSSSITEYPSQAPTPTGDLPPETSISGSTGQRPPPYRPDGTNSALQAKQLPSPNISRKASNDFFSDIPLVPKQRQGSAGGRYVPSGPIRTTTAPPSSSQLSQNLVLQRESQARSFAPPPVQSLKTEQDQHPPEMSSATTKQTSSPPSQPSRYSPAPSQVPSQASRYSQMPQMPPSRASRYSPAPSVASSVPKENDSPGQAVAPPAMQAAQPYAPRTSSPLTYGSVLPHQPVVEHAESNKQLFDANYEPDNKGQSQFMSGAMPDQSQYATGFPHNKSEAVLPHRPERNKPQTPPSMPTSVTNSPQRSYIPEKGSQMQQISSGQTTSPGRKEQIHTSRTMASELPYNSLQSEPSASSGTFVQEAPTTVRVSSHQRRRTITQGLEFVRPADSRAADPLERWRGCPIFHWGLGGSILLHFPQQVPRYGTGHGIPTIQCNPGEVTVHSIKALNPLSQSLSSFPGPLKGKSKKKDVSGWLEATIKSMAAELESSNLDNLLPSDLRQRKEEMILLWKVMQILVDHSGVLEGNSEVNEAVARVLADSEPTNSMTLPIQEKLTHAIHQGDHASPQAIQEIHSNLLQGEREKAVWYAADQGLWAHAMLISSTLRKDVWKQVIQEFARQDVKKAGESTESLAALYQVFAGNWEESIDELVPPSERAGFQMVRKDTVNPARNALQGLERWRETVRLIVNNRSNEDHRALHALGKLLASYGRPEAAHICFLFAGSLSKFGGADDPQTDIVLLGADYLNQKLDLDLNLDAILLTEIYEYALTLTSSSAPTMPYLQVFKLRHSILLAENGYRNEALQYCDAISAAIKATPRPSPYYHPNLITQLDDLSKRLSKSPKDSSSSWIPKPSMEKVSGSMWAKFNSFVAGDDGEKTPENTNIGASDSVGPLTSLTGTPPNVPLQAANNIHPIYSSNPQQTQSFVPPAISRYTPVSSQINPSSIHTSPSGLAPQLRGASPSQSYQPGSQSTTVATVPLNPQVSHDIASPYPFNSTQPPLHNVPIVPQTPGIRGSNIGITPMSVDVTEQIPLQTTSRFDDSRKSYFPDGNKLNHSGKNTNHMDEQVNSMESDSGYQSTAGYIPPSSSYEPPSYQPYVPQPDDEKEQPRESRKAKSMVEDDNDDDLMQRAAALTKEQKSQADKVADDAFRKAAEADGKL